jgi:hypothetical protein
LFRKKLKRYCHAQQEKRGEKENREREIKSKKKHETGA